MDWLGTNYSVIDYLKSAEHILNEFRINNESREANNLSIMQYNLFLERWRGEITKIHKGIEVKTSWSKDAQTMKETDLLIIIKYKDLYSIEAKYVFGEKGYVIVDEKTKKKVNVFKENIEYFIEAIRDIYNSYMVFHLNNCKNNNFESYYNLFCEWQSEIYNIYKGIKLDIIVDDVSIPMEKNIVKLTIWYLKNYICMLKYLGIETKTEDLIL